MFETECSKNQIAWKEENKKTNDSKRKKSLLHMSGVNHQQKNLANVSYMENLTIGTTMVLGRLTIFPILVSLLETPLQQLL